MSKIIDILKKNRPELSLGSIRTYSSIIKNLGIQMNIDTSDPNNICKNYKKIIDHLKDVQPKLRKTRLSALVVYCDKNEKFKDEVDAIRSLMLKDDKEAEADMKEQKLSDKQKEAMIPYDEVMSMYNRLEKEVAPLLKMNNLDKNQFNKVQLYVLLSCLLLIPPRRSLDYTEFKIRNVDKEKDNYMDVIKRKPYFVFNQYKTAKKYKTQQVEVPKKLKTIIDRWTSLNPHEYLLMNTRQTGKITPTQLTNMLYQFFGKNISTSMLRHIYLSNVYKDVPALLDMEKRASDMGNSIKETFETYVKKK